MSEENINPAEYGGDIDPKSVCLAMGYRIGNGSSEFSDDMLMDTGEGSYEALVVLDVPGLDYTQLLFVTLSNDVEASEREFWRCVHEQHERGWPDEIPAEKWKQIRKAIDANMEGKE